MMGVYRAYLRKVFLASTSSNSAWISLFVFLVAATQLQSLLSEVIGWDESTFILMASNILSGNLPYLSLWDNKPPFLFFSLALAMKLFGETLTTVRLFGDACLLLTAIITYFVCLRINDKVASGVAVAAMISVASLRHFNPTMTELLVILLLMLSLWLVLTTREYVWSAFLVGGLMSLATLTRLNISYVVIALGLYYVFTLFRPGSTVHRHAVIGYVIGGIIPLSAIVILYWTAGGLETFFLSVFVVPLEYATTQVTIPDALLGHANYWFKLFGIDAIICGPFTLLVCIGVVCFLRQGMAKFSDHNRTGHKDWIDNDFFIILVFSFSILFSILSSGAFFPHYWIQLFPLAAIFASYSFTNQNILWTRQVAHLVSWIVIFAALFRFGPDSIGVLQNWNTISDKYVIRRAANYILEDKSKADRVYALNAHLIYWYLKQDPPTRLAHPSNLVRQSVIRPLAKAGYIEADEFGRILRQKNRYIVKRQGAIKFLAGKPEEIIFKGVLVEQYRLWKNVGEIEIYKLR